MPSFREQAPDRPDAEREGGASGSGWFVAIVLVLAVVAGVGLFAGTAGQDGRSVSQVQAGEAAGTPPRSG